MAQHDYVIDNQSFPATRSDLNSLFQAIASCNSGATAPSTTYANQIWYDTANNKLYIRNEDNDAWIALFELDQSGDVASTLATIIDVLDASGTNTAGTDLTIRAGAGTGTGAGGKIILQTADGGSSGSSVNSHATAVTIADDGNVGIGTTPEAPLHVKVGTNENFRISSDSGVRFQAMNDAASAINTMKIGGDPLIFLGTGGTERMRVDSSGDLFVAKTSQNVDTDGHELRADGVTVHTANGASPLFLNRRSSDGTVATFMRSGTTVGAIGAVSGDIFFAGPDDNHAALRLAASARTVLPVNSSGALSDNSTDLGQSSARFDDIFATNGTIQTSDQNEKQQIASLTDAEIAAAKRISNGFKTFKWNDAVTAKGDNARTHAGVIAQEVRTALEAEGLDAGKYAFFMSNTWWEHDVEVPAVEAVKAQDAVLDDDGNIVTEAVEAVEAQDAYTRTDIYDTADEAPEGATERTRLGIRYPELLAFVGAATEQRLASIEARLTALEA